MKSGHVAILLLSLLLTSGCSALLQSGCGQHGCEPVENNPNQLNIWWSAALRDGGGHYSTVSVND